MCTILFSWKSSPDHPLILIANRDEFYERKTKNAHWWDDHPDVLGGRDLQAGGTWMGINRNGRFAAITNYRKFPLETYSTSRGDLVKNFLIKNDSADDFMNFLIENGQQYDGFNLLFGNPDKLFYFSNRGPEAELKPSLYGLSNHLLDTPWPKVERGKELFHSTLKNSPDNESFFKILKDNQHVEDHLLPETGVGLEKERMLSPIYIESDNYGTRLSTVLTIDKKGNVDFHERSYVPQNEVREQFTIG